MRLNIPLIIILSVALTKKASQSVVRTLRLDRDLNDYLVQEAKKSNISISALASEIFTSYRDRYRFVEKLSPVAITPGNLVLFLECIRDEDLQQIAPKLASKLCLFAKHVFDPGNFKTDLDWCITNLLPASHWFTCNRSNESYMITHQMGPKWTTFLTKFLSSLISAETGKTPTVEVDNEIILVKKWN